jgi:prepilin-type N-terminal cleavage/methylation domain-containing protein
MRGSTGPENRRDIDPSARVGVAPSNRLRRGAGTRGFTLIEMLVVVAMVGILTGLGVAGFAGLTRKTEVGNQARRIQTDLSKVKVMAMTKGRTHFVALNANGYVAYDDTNPAPDGNDVLAVGSDTPILRSDEALNLSTVTTLRFYPIAWSGGAEIDFNSRGLCTTAAAAPQTICIPSDANPHYDCVSVSSTRILLGKLAVQGVCSAANCQIQ